MIWRLADGKGARFKRHRGCRRTSGSPAPRAPKNRLAPPPATSCESARCTQPLGHRNGTARVEHIEGVRRLQDHFVGRQCQRHFQQALGFGFVVAEQREQELGVRMLEVIGRLLHLVLMEYVAVSQLLLDAAFPIRSTPGRRRFPRLAGTSPGARCHR